MALYLSPSRRWEGGVGSWLPALRSFHLPFKSHSTTSSNPSQKENLRPSNPSQKKNLLPLTLATRSKEGKDPTEKMSILLHNFDTG